MIDIHCSKYYSELEAIVRDSFPGKTFSILVTGATGLIGSCMVDTLIYANECMGYDIAIYALGRSSQRICNRFGEYTKKDYFHIVEQDAQQPLDTLPELDYIVGMASNADPATYQKYPVETITTNVLGTYHMVEYAKKNPGVKMLFTSTNEVYGAVESDDFLKEDVYGNLNYNIVRSGYPESKRVAELLIRSAVQEYGIHATITRLGLIYGPTMTSTDNKVVAQFIRAILQKQNITLKSTGKTHRTYCYVTDVVSALFAVLLKGENGEAYNIANDDEIVSIYSLAKTAAEIAGTQVVIDLPEDYNEANQPKDKLLSTEKLRTLGWQPRYSIREGLLKTVDILQA